MKKNLKYFNSENDNKQQSKYITGVINLCLLVCIFIHKVSVNPRSNNKNTFTITSRGFVIMR